MVELVDVKKTFNAGQSNEYTAVDGVTLYSRGEQGHRSEGAERVQQDYSPLPDWMHGPADIGEDQALPDRRDTGDFHATAHLREMANPRSST